MTSTAAWNDVLGIPDAGRIFGRDAELRRLDDFSQTGAGRILYVFGSPGAGKTSLLREWMRREAGRGARVAFFDAAVESFRPDVVRSLAEGATVIGFDDFHRLALLETWFYDAFVPSLAPDVRIVIASRRPPRSAELADPNWRKRIDVMELGPLSSAESEAYLESRAVPSSQRQAIMRFAQGLPLWLSVGAELALTLPDQPLETIDAREPLMPLVEMLVGEAEDAGIDCRRALEAASLFLFVTESRLARALDVPPETAATAYRWLRERPFIQRAAEGVRIHDTLRAALRADFAWRDPEGLESMLDRIYAFIVERIRSAKEADQERNFLELCRMLRKEPGGALLGGDVDEEHYADAVTDEETAIFVEAVRRHEGEESAAIARLWLSHARDGLIGFRDAERRLVGFVFYVRVDASVPAAVAKADPFVPALLDALARDAPLREGERATIARFWLGIDGYQRPDAMQLRLWVHMTWKLVLAADDPLVGAVNPDPEEWLRRPDRAHDLFATFECGGRPYGVFGQDWRRASREPWFERMVAAYRRGPHEPPGVSNEMVVLDRARFDQAVRAALRSWSRPARLEGNALLRTRLVPDRSVDGLRQVLGDAVASLARESKSSRHAEILEHAFMRKEQKGIAIAAELGLPYGSYRRLLGDAVERLVEGLWARERT